jgi:hypothetical protein
MGPYMAVPPQEAGQADLSLQAIAVADEEFLFFHNGPERTSNREESVGMPMFSHADLELPSMRSCHVVL